MITDADLIPVFSLDGLAIEATFFDLSETAPGVDIASPTAPTASSFTANSWSTATLTWTAATDKVRKLQMQLPVFFSEGSDRVEMYDLAVEAVEPNIIARSADVAGVRRGWLVSVNSREYTVERIQNVGTGVTVLYLKRVVD